MLKNLLLCSVLFLNYTIQAQSEEQRAEIKKDINLTELNLLQAKFQKQFEMDEAKVATYLASNPLVKRTETKNGSVYYIKSIDEKGNPVYINTKSNIDSGELIKANSLYSGGSIGTNITGTGMVVGVWDGGQVRATHELLSGQVTMQPSQTVDTPGGNEHMTHVTGTIVGKELPSTNPNNNARGIAYNATARCYDWDNDDTEMTAFAGQGYLISNHSYGLGNGPSQAQWTFGAYNSTAKDWDALLKNTPNYMPFVAGGNEQTSNGSGKTGALQGYDVITGSSAAKNVVTVGAVNGDRTMSSYSNFGPTDDGRIKPDICARGTGINSSVYLSDTAYETQQGTSMASPAAAAAALLLQQYYYSLNNSYMSASMLKALLLHSADDEGTPGPDPKFGWGILNIERAAQIIKDAKTTRKARMHTFTTNPTNDASNEINIYGGGTATTTPGISSTSNLRASICWTDNEGVEQTSTDGVDPTASRLVYNFDMLFRRLGSAFAQAFPFKKLSMSSPTAAATVATNWWQNNVDNYRQANIPAGGTDGNDYYVYIRKNATSPATVRNISVIVTGLVQTTLSNESFEENKAIVFYSSNDNKLKLISNEIYAIGNYSIFDTTGKLVQKGKANSNEIEINSSAKGMYIAVFENENLKQSVKFIK
jgi:serine protease AprX